MRYHEIITETMISPYRWTHKAFATYLDMESWSASFKTDADLSYLVDIWVPREESSVDVSFRLLTGASRWWGRENTGDAFRVMATVRDILRQYIESQHPDQIVAEADEENRARLYSRMLSGIPNYTMKTEQGGVGTKFILTRNV